MIDESKRKTEREREVERGGMARRRFPAQIPA